MSHGEGALSVIEVEPLGRHWVVLHRQRDGSSRRLFVVANRVLAERLAVSCRERYETGTVLGSRRDDVAGPAPAAAAAATPTPVASDRSRLGVVVLP